MNMKNSMHDSYFQDLMSSNRFLYICGLFFILLSREVKLKFVLLPTGRYRNRQISPVHVGNTCVSPVCIYSVHLSFLKTWETIAEKVFHSGSSLFIIFHDGCCKYYWNCLGGNYNAL